MSQVNTAKSAALTSKKPHAKKPARPAAPQRTKAQSQMESQLTTLFNLSTQRSLGQMPDIKDIGEEGIDHINVHRNSKSKLGYLLSTAANHDFLLFNKRFTSIDNLNMFYRSHCTVDALATGSVGLVRDFNRSRVKSYPMIKNLFVVACLGYIEIFKRTPALMAAMEANKLPLDSYDFDKETKKRRRHQASATLVQAVQEAFQAVRDNREPDLRKFMFNDIARSTATRAALAGLSFEELVRSEFSPRAIRESFQTKHAELAAQIRDEMTKHRDEQKALRNAKSAKPASVSTADTLKQQAMELGDAVDILKQEKANTEKITQEVKETQEAVEQEVARLTANTTLADPIEADGVTKITERTDDTVDFERQGVQNAAPSHDQLGTVDNSDPITPAAPITE